MEFLLWHGVSRSAKRHAARPAVNDGSTVLNYAELDAASGQFAALLMSWGVGSSDRVALLVPKSARAIVAMIGTSKSGAAYVPVDPAAPASRSAYIIGNAEARVLVTTRRLLASLGEFAEPLSRVRHVVLVDAEEPGASSSLLAAQLHGWGDVLQRSAPASLPGAIEYDPAYILYTSGSTGRPKGVVISHRNALAFVDWALSTFRVESTDRLANHAPFHFDLSVFDLYAAFGAGACVYPIPDRVAPFPVQLAEWIKNEGITVWYSVPSALIRLLKHGALERFDYSGLRTVLFAGEVFPVRHLRDVMERFPAADFFNLYGPTETNVCTYLPVPRPIPEEVADLSIGVACENYDTFAITDEGTRAGVGEEGELVVRGPGVMLGYWGLPERTATSLVQNPLNSRFVDLIYRTGDLVRVREDGAFTFLGRRDHMVKTRGYRIELGDIEHTLHQHPAVHSGIVVPVPDDEIGARLIAVVVPEEEMSLTPEELTGFCRLRLPHYAVPEHISIVQDLPRTSTGKVDRQAVAQTLVITNSP